MSLVRRLLGGSRLIGYAVTFAAGGVQIFAALVLSRLAFAHLTQAELRIWFVLMGAMPFVALFELGANVVLPHRFHAAARRPAEVSNIVAGFVVCVLLLLLAALIIGQTTLTLLQARDSLDAELAALIRWAALGGAVRVVGNVMQGTLYALGDNTFDKGTRIVATLTMLLVAGVALSHGLGVASMPLGWGCAGVVSVMAGCGRLNRRWAVRLPTRRPKPELLGAMLRDASRYIFIAVPGQMVFNATPFIIAARLPATATIGFGLTQQLIAGLALLATLPVTVGTPGVVEALSRSREEAARRLLSVCRTGAILSACALAVVGFARQDIVTVWVGHPVPLEAGFIGLYFFAMFAEWQQGAMTTATMSAGNFRFVGITIASASLVLLGMPVALDHWGLLGVPITLLVAQSLTCHPYNLRQAFKTFDLSLVRYLRVLKGGALGFAVVTSVAAVLAQLALAGPLHLFVLSLTAAVFVAHQLRPRSANALAPETPST